MSAYAWQWLLVVFALIFGLVALENLREWSREASEKAARSVAERLRALARRARGLTQVTATVTTSWDVHADPPTLDARVSALESRVGALQRDVDDLVKRDAKRQATVRLSAWWASASLVLALAAGLIRPNA